MKNDRVYILREAVVKITQLLAGKGITVTQQGVNAYVKNDHRGVPVLVNLPYLPDNATEELCMAIQGFLDHEVAHILFTDFTAMGKAKAISDQTAFMLNVIEDTRIEREMSKRFQGSAYNLAVTGQFYLDKYVTPRIQEAAAKGDANAVIRSLITPMIRAMSGQNVFQSFMKDKWKTVAPVYERIKDLESKIANAATTEDCLELAKEIEKRLASDSSGGGGKTKQEKKEAGSGGGKGGSGKGKSKSKPEKGEAEPGKSEEEKEEKEKEEGPGGAGEGEDEKDGEKSETEAEGEGEDEEGEGEDKSEGEGEDKSEEDGDIKEDDEEESEETDPVIGEGSEEDPAGESSGEESDLDSSAPIWAALDKEGKNNYDESMSRIISDSATSQAKNATYLPFTRDHDVIEKLPVGRNYDAAMGKKLSDAVDHMVAPLQKDLERAIAARSLAVRSHGHRSGKLHAANLTRLKFNDDRVFSRKQESTSKDVAVELVVDCSGSMSGSKIYTASQAAYALSSVLDRLNIKNEVIGFTTKDIGGAQAEMYKQQSEKGVRFSRAEGLYMPILKGYDERINTEVRNRFGWLPNTNILRSNVDGECVEIAARRLLARKEAGKIMIVLSDGYPAAAGSRADLESHLKGVVQEVSRAGVNVVGIGIESDAVKKFYPKNIVLNSVSELPNAVIKELRHLLMV